MEWFMGLVSLRGRLFHGIQCRWIIAVVFVMTGGGVKGTVVDPTSCPAMCRCDVSTQAVDCSRQGLVTIPSDVPLTVISLYMRTNSFHTLESSLFHQYLSLKVLDFQNNSIITIEPNAFRNLYQLERLNLRDNQMKSIASETFHHLVKLKEIDLTNNRITSVSSTAFKLMPDIQNINFRHNSLECGCEEALLQAWHARRQVRTGVAVLEEARCGNYGNEMLESAVRQFQHQCPTQASAITCPKCQSVPSIDKCLERETCNTDDAVCLLSFEVWPERTSFTAGCQTRSTCTQSLLPANTHHCPQSGNQSCNLCCSPPDCSLSTLLIGFSRKEDFDIRYNVNEPWDDDYKDPTSKEFGKFVKPLESDTKEALSSLDKEKCSIQINSVLRSRTLIADGDLECKRALDMTLLQLRNEIDLRLQAYLGKFIRNVTFISVSHQHLCAPLTFIDNRVGTILFPAIEAGKTAVVPCPNNPQQKASMRCVGGITGSTWQDSDITACYKLLDRERDLGDLAGRNVTNDTVGAIVKSLVELTDDVSDYRHRDVVLVSDVITKVTQTSDVKYNTTVGGDLLQSINNMLQVNLNTLVNAEKYINSTTPVSKLISAAEVFGNQIATRPGEVQKLFQTKIAASVTPVGYGGSIAFTTSGNLQGNLTDGRIEISRTQKKSEAASDLVASIMLPGSVVRQGGSDENVNFVIYNSDSFFKAAEMVTDAQPTTSPDGRQLILNSRIVSAKVGRRNLTNLKDEVIVTLTHLETTNRSNPRCVFWDFTLSHWSDEGCRVAEEREGSTVCKCNHLTNFALIMDIFGNAGNLSRGHKIALSFISYIGCGVSMCGLVLTLITYFSFRKLLKDNPAKILVNLCVALLGILVGFIFGTQIFVRQNAIACKIFAGFLHYFVLSSMLWMVIEAFYMYIALVRVFHTYYSRFILKCCLIGWGIPLVAVGITIGISRDNYGLQGEICWLARIPFLVALMAPVAIILILNCIAFGLVINQLRQMDNKKIERSKKSNITSRLRGAIAIMVLLGLTWIFAFFAIGGASIVFHYLFAICNSLQGLFIFIFYCLLKREAQNQWMRCMGCERFVSNSQSSSKDTEYSSVQTIFKPKQNSIHPVGGRQTRKFQIGYNDTGSTDDRHTDSPQNTQTTLVVSTGYGKLCGKPCDGAVMVRSGEVLPTWPVNHVGKDLIIPHHLQNQHKPSQGLPQSLPQPVETALYVSSRKRQTIQL